MSARIHQLLAELSERQSKSEAETLKKLNDYKMSLNANIAKCESELAQLISLRDQSSKHGTAAIDLIMLEQSLSAQHLQLQALAEEILLLDQAINEQRQKWALIHQRHKVHERMSQTIEKQELRAKAHQRQKAADQQYAAQMVMQRGVGSS